MERALFVLKLRNFWSGAESPSALFPALVSKTLGQPIAVTIDPRAKCDLEIVCHQGGLAAQLRSLIGPQGLRRVRTRQIRWSGQEVDRPSYRRSIWYTGENVRPPYSGDWSGFLSFDLDDLGGRNAYLPLWFHKVHELNGPAALTLSSLMEPRNWDDAPRERFVCAFIGNPEPWRFHILSRLADLGRVDVYGHSVGAYVDDRHQTSRNYRFILSFENDVYPGYVTEKALEGFRSGAVLLWRGLDSAGFLNPGAHINLNSLEDSDELLRVVARLDGSSAERQKLLEAPVLKRRPTLDFAQRLIETVLDDA